MSNYLVTYDAGAGQHERRTVTTDELLALHRTRQLVAVHGLEEIRARLNEDLERER